MDAAGGVQVAAVADAEAVQECAAIWARATTSRDPDREPATVNRVLPGIQRRLRIAGATLLLARRDGHPAGFVLVAPRAVTLEILYLGVDPEAWGSGVGTGLLLAAEGHARAIGRAVLELWVIDDNERAVRFYRRSGFTSTAETARAPSSGRLERRFVRHLSPGGGA